MALAAVACTSGGDQSSVLSTFAESTTTPVSQPTTTPSAVTTTSSTTSTTTAPPWPPEALPIDPTVREPDGNGPFPVAVLVHGGSWVVGAPGAMTALARLLTEEGYITINTNYQLSDDQPGFPDAIRDVACAVRLGHIHPGGDGTVVLIGHSAGAHISAVVALTGDEYVAGFYLAGEIRIHGLHAVMDDFLRRLVQIGARCHDVGIDAVAVDPGASRFRQWSVHARSSLGSAIWPATALAATV